MRLEIGRTENVAGTSHGMDELRLAPATTDLAAQPADMRLDDVGLGIEVKIPHALEQHCARDHAIGMTHEKLQEAELARLEIDPHAAACHHAFQQVEFEIAN